VRIGDGGLAAGSVGYGVLGGGTSGSGVILLSLLMATGLEGAAVIATDAMISLGTGLIKISVFGLAGAVTAQVLAFALLIGGIAIPGAFLAKAFVERMPVHIHTAILDVAVITGGLVMISAAARQLHRHERFRRRRQRKSPALIDVVAAADLGRAQLDEPHVEIRREQAAIVRNERKA
ncbi:hypothetical protein KXV85_003302, partial [Aspergillus fumigatus]